ncbi:hypothetical protein LY90DRAFT_512807 [Neocallimastix californiae]|uniref:Glycosyltransferase 2-like domain-containing protein n=1 Tax=Neocallimastix californiae TaxID=1754190 RepID=A0A1Y2B4E5_9FUNG|nr:hypothetical protein LY90DRAFT_512807 [Neocallimastix californiae]|eukprot:ORY29709.1 hypothetical protein LY90DRAFT_512807 [Neocallimastix californiae]
MIGNDKLKDVISDYVNIGFVNIISNRDKIRNIERDDKMNIQGNTYKDCYYNNYKEFDWMFFFKVEEFISIDYKYNNIFEFLNDFNEYDGIEVQNRIYGDNGNLYYENKPVIERFRNNNNVVFSNYVKILLKCKNYNNNLLFNNNGIIKKGLHIKDYNNFTISKHYEGIPVYLDYYYTKSTEEYIKRNFIENYNINNKNKNNKHYSFNHLKKKYFKYNKVTKDKKRMFNLLKKKDNFVFQKYQNIIKEKAVISKEIINYYLNYKSNNTINNTTLIISMTSYPPRINGVFEIFISLLYQSANISSYQCFLTLAREEFINGEKDLPENLQKLINNGWVKLLWYHNILSHKKLIPVLQKYPENDILIVDDDIIRTYNFVEIFQKEHDKYPNYVICGIFLYIYDYKLNIHRLNGPKGEKCNKMSAVPDIIFQTGRPANGAGGVLYPKHTFTDKRFFNETLFMNLSPTSDESWQYTFNIIENRILKQTSTIIDFSVNFIEGSQKLKTSLYRINKKKYSVINENIINYFPEYKENSKNRQKKIIVSITSYKRRLKNLHLVLESIFKNKMKPSKVVLTLYKDDLPYLTDNLKYLIDNNMIELIIANNNLRSHLKYFEVMKKYREYAIITIDDDIIYSDDLIESLYNSYTVNPNCVHARRVHKIITKNKKVLEYKFWKKEYKKELNASFELFATNVGGTLYPPNILNISDDNIDNIKKCITADDIYLKYLENKRNIEVIWVPNKNLLGLKQLNDKETQKEALYKINTKGENLNDKCIQILNI